MPDGWVPDPRPVLDELTETFKAAPYRPPMSVPVMDMLDKAMRDKLEAFKLIGGGIGDPDSH